jgi:hypothetical protein
VVLLLQQAVKGSPLIKGVLHCTRDDSRGEAVSTHLQLIGMDSG